MTMTLIETKTLGTAADGIEFINIPQDGTDLVAFCSTRERDTNTYTSTLSINGSVADLSVRLLQGSGTAAITAASTIIHILSSPSFSTANSFGSTQIYFPNYSGSTNKSFSIDSVSESNAVENFQRISAALRSNTAPITSLTISGGLAAGSTISLYKITKGSGGATVS